MNGKTAYQTPNSSFAAQSRPEVYEDPSTEEETSDESEDENNELTPEENSQETYAMAPGSTASQNDLFEQTKAQIQALNEEIEKLKKQKESPAKAEKPAIFKGEANKIDSFLLQCEIYFRGKTFPLVLDRTMFAISRMEGEPMTWIQPTLDAFFNKDAKNWSSQEQADINTMKNWTEFKAKLKERFQTGDEKSIASQRLRQLKQKGPAAKHATIFTQIAAKTSWNDEALADIYYDTLREEIKDEIYRLDERPETFQDMKARAIKIDNRLWERRMQKSGKIGAYRPDKQYNNRANSGKSRTDPYGLQPMELDAVQPKDEAKKKGSCFYCGKKGHFARDCRQKKENNKSDKRTKNGPRRQPEHQLRAVEEDFQSYETEKEDRIHIANDSEDEEHTQRLRATDTKISTHEDLHARKHWTFCYQDDCLVHRDSKDKSGYWPKRKHTRRAPKLDTVSTTWNKVAQQAIGQAQDELIRFQDEVKEGWNMPSEDNTEQNISDTLETLCQTVSKAIWRGRLELPSHKNMTWEKCEEIQAPHAMWRMCPHHENQKLVAIQRPDHPRHMEYIHHCECKHHAKWTTYREVDQEEESAEEDTNEWPYVTTEVATRAKALGYLAPRTKAEGRILTGIVNDETKAANHKLNTFLEGTPKNVNEEKEEKLDTLLNEWTTLSEEEIKASRGRLIQEDELSDNSQVDYCSRNNWSHPEETPSDFYDDEINVEDTMPEEGSDRAELQAVRPASLSTASTDESMPPLEEVPTQEMQVMDFLENVRILVQDFTKYMEEMESRTNVLGDLIHLRNGIIATRQCDPTNEELNNTLVKISKALSAFEAQKLQTDLAEARKAEIINEWFYTKRYDGITMHEYTNQRLGVATTAEYLEEYNATHSEIPATSLSQPIVSGNDRTTRN